MQSRDRRDVEQRSRAEVGHLQDVRDADGHLLFRISECGFIQVRPRRGQPVLVDIFKFVRSRRS